MRSPLLYLDPGTGSMLVQIVLGGAAAVAVGMKMTWRRLLAFLHIRRDEPDPAAESEGSSAH